MSEVYHTYWRTKMDEWLNTEGKFPSDFFSYPSTGLYKMLNMEPIIVKARENAKILMDGVPKVYALNWRNRIVKQYKANLCYISSLMIGGEWFSEQAEKATFYDTGFAVTIVGAIGKSLILCYGKSDEEIFKTFAAKCSYS